MNKLTIIDDLVNDLADDLAIHGLSRPDQLPSVDKILQSSAFTSLNDCYGREAVTPHVRTLLDGIRQRLLHPHRDSTLAPDSVSENSKPGNPATVHEAVINALYSQIENRLNASYAPSLKRVINLTGTILHTNLGRAPYPPAAIDAMVEVSRGACNLEYDLEIGQRGRRDDHVEKWICKFTGAEAATTVNNNAAAVLLTLNSIARKKNVIVSRGELIEIGGSFRVPAIMKKAGCKLREVGTTNRTHLKDYEDAITKKTAAIMKVHTSNYEINGFTKSVAASELAAVAQHYNIPLIDDLGSGTLTDLSALGLPFERTTKQAIADGADLITFSGDKLLGGPQCGIIAGRSDLIRLIDKNPLKRAMRLDKVTLAALEAVLKLYAKPDQLSQSIPSLKLLSRQAEDIHQSALGLQDVLIKALAPLPISVQPCQSQIGSGALPTKTLASYAVVIDANETTSIGSVVAQLRSLPVPVIGRVSQNSLWLDCRALTDELEEIKTLITDHCVVQ